MNRAVLKIDVRAYKGLLKEAMAAFSSDSAYCIAIVKAANNTSEKKFVWRAKSDIEASEKEAVAQCRELDNFKCEVLSPCGTGKCPFAQGDLVNVQVECRGLTFRPQLHNMGSYDLDEAVKILKQLRSSS